MLQLRMLGSLRVTASDGRDVESIVRQSKRTALLAYLAVAKPRGPHRRDKLLALFWPESDALHARAALNQALYVLRSALGEEAVPPREDGLVAIDDHAVWCDARAFENALDGDRPAEALALYQGDLLDGFFVSDAPEFEHWLDGERARLRQRAADGAWLLAEAKAAKGETIEAARWGKRASELLPTEEATVRRLMSFLHALGDRTAAIRAYEAFAWRLEQEYELEPGSEVEALAAAIRRTDDRIVAPPALPVVARQSKIVTIARRTPTAARLAIGSLTVIAFALVARASERQLEAPVPEVTQFALEFGDVMPLLAGTGHTIALSPDGTRLVYVGDGAHGPQLFVRSMDRLETRPIPGTRDAGHLFFSPDGAWVGFTAGNEIRKVLLAGGVPVAVCPLTTNTTGASWGPDNTIVFSTGTRLWRVPATGGQATILATADTAHGQQYRWPHVLPNGRAALFTRVGQDGFHLAVVSLETGTVDDLGLEGTDPRYVPPGYLVFARMGGALLATPFDLRTLRATGATVPIKTEGVVVGNAGAAKVTFSRAATLAYVPDLPDGPLVVVDRAGRITTLPNAPRGVSVARFSPDGKRLAIAVRLPGEESDIWVLDLVASSLRRVTFNLGAVGPTPWTPDGRRIAFGSKPGGRSVGFILNWAAVDSSGVAEPLLPGAVRQLPDAFTPDGRSLVFQRVSADTRGDLWVLPLDGKRTPKPYLQGPSDERNAVISPDGHWLAYVSDESGRDEVYARGFPDATPPVQISLGGGREPRWASNGRELFYRSDSGMIAATVRAASPLHVESRKVLFDDRPYVSWRIGAAYDVHPDGERFVMVRRGSERRDVIIVLNWLNQLRR